MKIFLIFLSGCFFTAIVFFYILSVNYDAGIISTSSVSDDGFKYKARLNYRGFDILKLPIERRAEIILTKFDNGNYGYVFPIELSSSDKANNCAKCSIIWNSTGFEFTASNGYRTIVPKKLYEGGR